MINCEDFRDVFCKIFDGGFFWIWENGEPSCNRLIYIFDKRSESFRPIIDKDGAIPLNDFIESFKNQKINFKIEELDRKLNNIYK